MRVFSRRKRPLHMGPYPMEKIRRVDKPTTLITDKIERVPLRANFFARAFYGDLGKKPAEEVRRFIAKYPLNRAIGRVHWRQVPIHKDEPAPTKAPIPNDPERLAEHIKATSYFLDADFVGICKMPEWAWYSHDKDHQPITTNHKYAIVIVIDQGWETMEASTGDDWISGAQSFRAYLKGSTVAVIVADYIRRLGYAAQAHSNADGDVQQVPLMLLAGLGEMSRIGEVVVNPFIGPRHKTAIITTDMPLEADQPIDFGLQDFCEKCRKCARECPAQAIPHGDKVLYNGYEIWKPDVVKCTTYRTTNQKGSACGRCMKVCPWNKEGILAHRLAIWAAIKLPWLRRFLIWLDDAFSYGRQEKDQRWWLDLETVDKQVIAARGTHEKDLHLERKGRKQTGPVAVYPVETLPKAGTKEAQPVDRKQGLQDAETAAAALKAAKTKAAL